MRIVATLTLTIIGHATAFTVPTYKPIIHTIATPTAPSPPSSSSQLFSTSTPEDTNNKDETTTEETSTKTSKAEKMSTGGHDVRNASTPKGMPQISEEEMAIQKQFMIHQKSAKTLGFPVDVRTLVEYNHGFAVLCTNSKSNEGYPSGSVVAFAPDADGRPIFLFSKISPHTQNVKKDKRSSLVIASKEFKGPSDGRVSLMGTTSIVPPDESEAVKALYMAKHPGAFWAGFGDFKWYRMEVENINFVGGFARAGAIPADEYKEAQPDAISEIGMQVASHMNDDHQSSTIAMVEQAIPGLGVSEALITSVDSLGMSVKVARTPKAGDQPQQFKLRLPFPRPAVARKDVKDIIVQMSREAAMDAAKKEAAKEEEVAPVTE